MTTFITSMVTITSMITITTDPHDRSRGRPRPSRTSEWRRGPREGPARPSTSGASSRSAPRTLPYQLTACHISSQLAISVQRVARAVCVMTGANGLQTAGMTGRQHTTPPQPLHRTLLLSVRWKNCVDRQPRKNCLCHRKFNAIGSGVVVVVVCLDIGSV